MRSRNFILVAGVLAPILLLLGLLLWGNSGRDDDTPGAVDQVLVNKDKGSPWTIDRKGARVTARLPKERLSVVIFGTATSEQFSGVSLTWRGRDYSTGYFGRKSPLLLPEHPRKSQELVDVRAGKKELFIRLAEGRIADLQEEGSRYSGPGKLVFEASIRPRGERLDIQLDGFYYIVLARNGTVLSSRGEEIHPDRLTGGLIYLDNPQSLGIQIDGELWGRLSTNVRKLQIEARDERGREGLSQAFELDFDHAFKDLGQSHIRSLLSLSAPDRVTGATGVGGNRN